MATKKAKKMAVKKAEPCACCAPAAGIPHVQDWLLIILGALGLATALGYISWPGYTCYVAGAVNGDGVTGVISGEKQIFI